MVFFQEALCIEANESEVAELYRSPAISLPIEGSPPLSTCAYLCVLKRDSGYRVYVAIHCRDIKRSLIYAVAQAKDDCSGFEDSLHEAQQFAGAIGFRLESVNLKYSPAMRAVVLREMPVLLSPDQARRLLQENAAEEAEASFLASQAAGAAAETDAESSPLEGSDRKQVREARIAAGRTAVRTLEMRKRLDEQAATLRRTLERALAEVNRSERSVEEQREREHLQAEIALTEKRIAELEKTVHELQEQLVAGQREREELAKASATGAKRQAELEKLLHKAQKQIETGEARRKEVIDCQAAAEERLAETAEKLRQAEERAEEERTARERPQQTVVREEEHRAELRQALEEARKTIAPAADGRVTELEKELQVSEQRLEQAQRALSEARTRAVTEQKKQAAALAAAEERIAALEKNLRDTTARAEAENPNLPPTAATDEKPMELLQALRQAEERSEFLRLEMERFANAKFLAEKRLSELEKELAPVATVPGMEPRTMPLLTVPPAMADAVPPPHVLRRPPRPGAFFHVDWDLTKIPVHALGDICEIHQSMTMIQLCLEGYSNQFCSAHIVVLNDGGAKRVYLPFRLSAINRILVFVPAKQPDNPAALARTMKEAGKFLKTVGMDTECLPLPKKMAELSRELDAILTIGHSPEAPGISASPGGDYLLTPRIASA